MKKLLLTLSCLVGVTVIGLFLNAYAQESTSIPNWVKSTAKLWVNGDVTDNDFEKGIQYLVQSKIIKISEIQQNSQSIQRVPPWVKSLAGLWINGQATDDDFAKAIEYLVNVGIIIVNVQSNQTNVQNQITPVATINQTNSSTPLNSIISSNNLPTRSLIGSGINLKIVNNTASGSLTLNGQQYNAPNLTIIINANEITLTGQIQGSSSVFLQATGIPTTGIEYNFNGVIMNGGNSVPVTFTALFTNPAGQSVPITIPNQNIQSTAAPQQVPSLPMLMLTSNNNRVYVGSPYNLVVRIFDPQSNPDKIFDQYYGGIPDINITATIVGQNNMIITQSIGKTDSNGQYQAAIIIPNTQFSQQTANMIINATKNGYQTQQITLPLNIVLQNR
ncbi:hypothetical protein [Candidatus Nitrosotalea bavarica]|uniref:hypothetical protein n=1 Tax=Candidatus Nitrosotalea bavarica TaxID=1903277 RepID=UPI000C713555|nr:hypothetical protein [Candidatus Nitrosotalea bavarica]